ncbi:uncharacterized protein BDW47DRAFT_105893 [Aspergillus candidus]|uniref:Uncharacterized protein n=1 Tax=Aspergillus candidus TaxID=41067 RepID=A0A2I2FB36_ASPCN|nr:hypothetical protein BDW47DRAFT_105893 [Aspergillus candidus]PLB37839.1 hypothetical protein BDW47DRAFT_105893 [Aspergillus candidus]
MMKRKKIEDGLSRRRERRGERKRDDNGDEREGEGEGEREREREGERRRGEVREVREVREGGKNARNRILGGRERVSVRVRDEPTWWCYGKKSLKATTWTVLLSSSDFSSSFPALFLFSVLFLRSFLLLVLLLSPKTKRYIRWMMEE